MPFKTVTRAGRVYYVPGALDVPKGQAADVREALVEGDTDHITFARKWEDVPLPVEALPPETPPVETAPTEPPPADPDSDQTAVSVPPLNAIRQTERRKGR